MTEADFQTRFSKWAKHNIKHTAAFELKICKEPSMPFNAVKEHQVANLLSARNRSLIYKIPDAGFDIKPFDCFMLSGCEAYVVVLFYQKRGDKEFYMININDYVKLMESSERKSLTKIDAQSWASITGTLA